MGVAYDRLGACTHAHKWAPAQICDTGWPCNVPSMSGCVCSDQSDRVSVAVMHSARDLTLALHSCQVMTSVHEYLFPLWPRNCKNAVCTYYIVHVYVYVHVHVNPRGWLACNVHVRARAWWTSTSKRHFLRVRQTKNRVTPFNRQRTSVWSGEYHRLCDVMTMKLSTYVLQHLYLRFVSQIGEIIWPTRLRRCVFCRIS